MDNQEGNIPEDADKLLFAEDFVSFVMTVLSDRPYEGTRATPYREFIHNAFNETVKAAVTGLAIRFHFINSTFCSMDEDISDPNESKFFERLSYIPVFHPWARLDAEYFLFNSVRIASEAAMYRDKGLQEAPDIAVSRIFESVRDCDMLSGGWDSLNVAATMLAKWCQDTLSLNSRVMDILGFARCLPCNSSSDEMDLSLLDEKVFTAAAEEKKEDKVPVDDSANSFIVHETINVENFQSTYSSTSNEHLQPSHVLQIVKENTIGSEKEMQVESETYGVDLKGRMISNQRIEAENRLFPSICESLQTLNISEVDSSSNTILNVDVNVIDAEDTSAVDKQTNSGYPPKCPDELKEQDNDQIFDIRKECEKRNLSEESSMLVASEGESETSGSCQLRFSSSESELKDEKTRRSR